VRLARIRRVASAITPRRNRLLDEPHDAVYWRSFPGRPCRWGMAGHPSNRLKVAMGGNPVGAQAADGERCEDVMAKTLAR